MAEELSQTSMYHRKNLYYAKGVNSLAPESFGPMPKEDAEITCDQWNAYPTTTTPYALVMSTEIAMVVYGVEWQRGDSDIAEVFMSYKKAKDKVDALNLIHSYGYAVRCFIIEDTRGSIYGDA